MSKKLIDLLTTPVTGNHIRFCGIGIAWGSFSSSGAWAHTFQYGITFSATPIVICSKGEDAASPSNITAVAKNTTQATVNFSTTANTKNVDWIAIGKI